MAIFDKNKNNRPDAGDKIGYYSITNMNTPSPITIIEGVNENINISAKYEIPSLSGYKMSVTGKFDIDANLLNSPVYTIIAKTSDPNTISENPMSVIKEFYRHSGDAQFNIDLSNTDLLPGDEVMVMTIAEQDLKRGEFPNPTRGDVIGIYQNPKDFKFSFKLKDGVNNINPDSNWTYSVNKTIKNNSVAISGILNDNDANDVLLIAYNKPFTSLNFSEFDINYVIGYKKFSKPTGDFSYTFNLLPYADDLPLNGISIIGLFDINQNGKPDAGDKIGFYSRSGSMPSVISLAGNQSGIDITPRMTIPASSSTPLSIAGNIDALSEYSLSEKPCYIVIAKTKFPSELIDNPISVIKDFKKLEAGQTDFNIDLSQTGLQENDEVMIVALWDKDAITGDFPNVTKGDVIGYFQNSRELQYTVKLKKGVNYIISNNDWRFNLNKEVYDYFAEVSGNITDPENGNVVMIAYAGEISSLDFTSINIDNVIGYSTINKTSETQPYRIKIIPCGKNIPISGVTIIAMLDSNNNGKPDENEKIGYYSLNNDNMPTSVTINSGTLNNINVNLSLSIPEPSGYNITLSGNFALPAGYTPDKPIYILAAHTSDPEILFNNPTSVIKENYV